MKFAIKSFILGTLVLGIAGTALSQEAKSSQAEAIALIKKAQEYVKTHGIEKAIAEFNNLESPFNVKSDINKHGDLYLFAIDFNGLQVVQGKNPKMRGKVTLDMRDAEGVYMNKALIDKCKSAEAKGWVDYKWPHPVTKNLAVKTSYTERIVGTDICIGTSL
jgi:cytochrome c